jgi:hypothetical protein
MLPCLCPGPDCSPNITIRQWFVPRSRWIHIGVGFLVHPIYRRPLSRPQSDLPPRRFGLSIRFPERQPLQQLPQQATLVIPVKIDSFLCGYNTGTHYLDLLLTKLVHLHTISCLLCTFIIVIVVLTRLLVFLPCRAPPNLSLTASQTLSTLLTSTRLRPTLFSLTTSKSFAFFYGPSSNSPRQPCPDISWW